MRENKFELLQDVKTVNIGNEMAVTLSMGFGCAGKTFAENYEFARIAIDLALARGGDQVVIREGEKISYFGGKTQQVEKTTRVKARVKAHALRPAVLSYPQSLPAAVCASALAVPGSGPASAGPGSGTSYSTAAFSHRHLLFEIQIFRSSISYSSQNLLSPGTLPLPYPARSQDTREASPLRLLCSVLPYCRPLCKTSESRSYGLSSKRFSLLFIFFHNTV